VYQTAAAPAATSNAPRPTTPALGAPVNGSVPAGLTPPPVLLLGLGLGGTVVGLTPPGGTVCTTPVGVVPLGVGELLGLTPP
jgi:hypothetical protein